MKNKLLTAAFILALLPLSGCTPQIPEPAPLSEPTAYPALDQERIEPLIGDVKQIVEKADEEKKIDLAAARLAGDAQKIRAAQYKYLDSPPALPLGTRSVTVSSSTSWPRYLLAANPSEDGKNVYIFLLTQDSATTQFKLVNWARVLPGQDFPGTANPDVGSKIIDSSNTTYQINPNEVVQAYAQMLDGKDSKLSEKMEESYVTKALKKEISDLRESLGDSGALSVNFKVSENPVVALELPEGSALAIGTIVAHSELEKTGNKILNMSGPVGQALGNDGLVEYKATWEYLIPVVFVVPSAESSEKISLIAAEKALISAS